MPLSAPIVIFGAGNLGRRVARAIHPALFCDNNRSLWGSVCEGTPVESPETAVQRYPSASFVIAIWHPSRTEGMMDRVKQLRSLGATNILSFAKLFPEYGDVLLPHVFWERPEYYDQNADDIKRARALMDGEGREEFDRQMQLRLGNVAGQVLNSGVQYFPVFQLGDSELFVDGGAYDGDTIAQFRRATGDHFAHIVAFEPDPSSYAALKSAINGDPRITLQPYGLGARRETVRFTPGGTSSKISSDGTCQIEVVTLDEALRGIAPTLMKFDIEGSEPDALRGGRHTIVRHRPKIAVCLYHCPDHLWSVPLLLNEMLPDSRFTLRTYYADGYECVCYCIPN
jgi:FkbM family methyltransferase